MHIKNLKVSSVLNHDRKLFGKQNLIDGNDDTCWNSAGIPLQQTQLEIEKSSNEHEIHSEFIILKTKEKFHLVINSNVSTNNIIENNENIKKNIQETFIPLEDEHIYLDLQFQGGFTPKRIDVYAQSINENGIVGKKCDQLYLTIHKIENSNAFQRFNLTALKSASISESEQTEIVKEDSSIFPKFDKLKLVLVGSSDIYGRIIVYHLRFLKRNELDEYSL